MHPGGRRPVELTETGRLVLAHARPLLARVKAVQADVAALALGEAGQLAVGTFQSFGARILPIVLARFRSVRPRVEVDIRGAVDVNELHAGVDEPSRLRPAARPVFPFVPLVPKDVHAACCGSGSSSTAHGSGLGTTTSLRPVSYSHLTPPTTRRGEIDVGAVTVKNTSHARHVTYTTL